jgi:hypothetical protein
MDQKPTRPAPGELSDVPEKAIHQDPCLACPLPRTKGAHQAFQLSGPGRRNNQSVTVHRRLNSMTWPVQPRISYTGPFEGEGHSKMNRIPPDLMYIEKSLPAVLTVRR